MSAAFGRRNNNTFCVSDRRRKQSVRSADCLRIFPLPFPRLPSSVGPCPPHPSSFGHFPPLSGRYAAISNELRVRKIYKTSEQLASETAACYLPPPPLAMCAVRGTVTSGHARLRLPARSREIVLRASYFSFPLVSRSSKYPPPVSRESGELAQVGRSFRTRR